MPSIQSVACPVALAHLRCRLQCHYVIRQLAVTTPSSSPDFKPNAQQLQGNEIIRATTIQKNHWKV